MAVEPIKYKHTSKFGESFCEANETKELTKSDAPKIKQDVDLGNTETPDTSQKYFLENFGDYDENEFTDEDNYNAGKNAVNTEGIPEDGGKTNDGLVYAAGGAAAVGGAAALGVGTAVAASATATAAATAGAATSATLASLDAMASTAMAPAAAATGGATSVEAACSTGTTAAQTGSVLPASVQTVFAALYAAMGAGINLLSIKDVFDPQLKTREQYRDGSTADEIAQGVAQLNNDMTTLSSDMDNYTTKSGEITDKAIDRNIQMVKLQKQIELHEAQGLDTTDDRKRIKAFQSQALDDSKDFESYYDNIEQIQSNKAYAEGVCASGELVKDFLIQGRAQQAKAIVMASLCALAGGYGALLYFGLITGPWDIAPKAANGILTAIGIAGFLYGVINFGQRAKDENLCARVGEGKVTETLNEAYESISGIDDAVNINLGEYAAADSTRASDVNAAVSLPLEEEEETI